MALFSERKGLTSVRNQMQKDSIDDGLRNGLWNLLTLFYWDKIKVAFNGYVEEDSVSDQLIFSLWHAYYKEPYDDIRNKEWFQVLRIIKAHFLSCAWFGVYNFIEFISKEFDSSSQNTTFRKACNVLFKREVSAYRFVDQEIVEITSKEEIAEIEEALHKTISPIQEHLSSALQHLSNKEKPDYRNSIKESINAVETMCKLVSGKRKATLGEALKAIEKKGNVKLHKALTGAFEKLYGYASDEQGIRHSLLEDPDLDFEDAKFILVSCSGFINYLKIKASKAGISL